MNCDEVDACSEFFGVTGYPRLQMFWNAEKYGSKYPGSKNYEDLTSYIEETIANITSNY
jgi:hypothetical protein